MYLTFAVLLGFLLDLLFGDPLGRIHPVCLIGRWITVAERLLRRLFPKTPRGETAAGVLLWIVVCGASFAAPFMLLCALRRVSLLLAFAAEAVLCWQILACKSLAAAGKHVQAAVQRSVEESRRAVSWYVGRDTAALDAAGVIRAAVETVAENTTDGVIAPLCFLLLGGVPLGMLYKAVNTLDSMVGYHNDQYEYLGKFSARMDDLFNFVPARLAACFLAAAAGLAGQDAGNAVRIFRRDRCGHKSPNAGQTEAVVAGALHIRLGGDASYFGQTVRKAAFGDDDRHPAPEDIARTVRMMETASILAVLCGGLLRVLL